MTAATLLFLAGAWWFLSREGNTLMAVVFVGLSAGGLAGILETAVRHIALHDEVLRVRGLLRSAEYRRQDVVRVSFERSSPVFVELADGRKITMPDLGLNAQSVANSIRAWARRGGGWPDAGAERSR